MKRSRLLGTLAVAMSVLPVIACSSGTGPADEGGAFEVMVFPDLPAETGPSDPGTPDPDVATDPNVHPYWTNARWDTFWPSGAAEYQVVDFDQKPHDLPATITEGQPLWGDPSGNWTRVAFGTIDKNNDAMALYVDKKTPWRIRVKQIAVFQQLFINPTVTTFTSPLEVPLDLQEGTPQDVTANGIVNFPSEDKEFETEYTFRIVAYNTSCRDVIAGLTGCATLQVILDNDDDTLSEVLLHPTQGILSWIPSPGYTSMQMTTAWHD